jgi:hypothetical protein
MKGKVFTAQEVQAIISGNKTQFREVIKPQPEEKLKNYFYSQNETTGYCESLFILDKCPYQVGQKIFCKESFWQFGGYDNGIDGDEPRFIGRNKITFCPEEAAKPLTLCKSWKKRPAQHMKQEHSRLKLQIKEIRVKRLQSISEEDAIAEGFKNGFHEVENVGDFPFSAYDSFAKNWNTSHKKPEEKFEANPFVFVYQFELIK